MKLPGFIIGLIFTVSLYSCGIYSYPSEIWPVNVSVDQFINNKKTNSPDLNLKIIEDLKEKLNKYPGFKVVQEKGTVQVKGSIIDYQIKPFSIGNNQEAITNRVIIKVNVVVIDYREDDRKKYKDFAAFADYDARQDFGMIKDSIDDILTTRIADEICYAFFDKW